MRVVAIEEDSPSRHWVLWGLSGAAVGIAAGVLLSERLSGRSGGARTLWRRARALARVAGTQWVPWLELALELKSRFWDGDDDGFDAEEAGVAEGEDWEDLDDDNGADNGDDNGLNAEDAEGNGEDAEDGNGGGDDGDDDSGVPDVIGSRVLEAFLNDPVLAERAVEIEADAEGAVLLHGRVATAREVSHAVTIAGGVPGVTGVRQRLRVRDRR